MAEAGLPPVWWWDKEYAVEYFKKIDTFEKFKTARADRMGPHHNPISVFNHLLEDVLKRRGTEAEYNSVVDALRPFLVPWLKEINDSWQSIMSANNSWALLDFLWLCRQWGFPDRQSLEVLNGPVADSFPKYLPVLDDALKRCKQ